MQLMLDSEKFYQLIKKAVKEALQEEMLKLYLQNLPLVSKEEMQDIEELYGEPVKDREIEFIEEIEV
ncbi:hypothetical protein V4D30_01235 [Thermodesulfovibrio sp. 3907-1M]|uniref:Uncharacterized protein n=1 Tax=Thermodesulfovibrio autotrophicus TaxID=3118333 RepID=A0AAU8GWK5_9BACT